MPVHAARRGSAAGLMHQPNHAVFLLFSIDGGTMRRPALLFLAALGLAGWAGADAVARPNVAESAAMPRREARTGDVVVQRSAASANVVVVVDGGTNGDAADGIADRVFVLQR